MRITPLVGRKVWFKPRRFGWGWDPVWWEGWAAMAVWLAASVACALLPPALQGPGLLVTTAALLAGCVLKGTRPGGPEAAERFADARRNAGRTQEMIEADRQRRLRTEDEPSVADAARRLRDVARKPEEP